MDAMLGKSTPMMLKSAPAGSLWLHGLGNSSEDIAMARTTYQQDPTKWTTGMLPNGDVVVFPKGAKVEKAYEADTQQENTTGGNEIVVKIKLPHGKGDSSDLDKTRILVDGRHLNELTSTRYKARLNGARKHAELLIGAHTVDVNAAFYQ